ncbi:MAG: endonuclease/exonuclease/phosphatase family protein [Bacteroidota bacterium]
MRLIHFRVRFILLLLTAFVAMMGCGQDVAPLRVLSYNIHYGIGMDGRMDLARIAKVINDSGADLVGLQEVTDEAMVAQLEKLTGMQGIFGPSMKRDKMPNLYGLLGLEEPEDLLYYGDAVLSKYPFRYVGNIWIPSASDSRYQAMAIDLLVDGFSDSLRMITTHFDYLQILGSEISRRAAVEVIEQHFFTDYKGLAILTGDLNATPKAKSLQLLQDKGWLLYDGGKAQPTVPVANPTKQIDYVMPRPANEWEVLDVEVLDEPVASDHLPLLMTLYLR